MNRISVQKIAFLLTQSGGKLSIMDMILLDVDLVEHQLTRYITRESMNTQVCL